MEKKDSHIYGIRLGSTDPKKRFYYEDSEGKRQFFRERLIDKGLLWVSFCGQIGEKNDQDALNGILRNKEIIDHDSAKTEFGNTKLTKEIRSIWQVCRSTEEDTFITFAAVGGEPMKLYYGKPEGEFWYSDECPDEEVKQWFKAIKELDEKGHDRLSRGGRFRKLKWKSECEIDGEKYELFYSALPGMVQAVLNVQGSVFEIDTAKEFVEILTSGDELKELGFVKRLQEAASEQCETEAGKEDIKKNIKEALGNLSDGEFERFIDLLFQIKHPECVPVGVIGGNKFAVDCEYVELGTKGQDRHHYYLQAKGCIKSKKMVETAISKLSQYCLKGKADRYLVYHDLNVKAKKSIEKAISAAKEDEKPVTFIGPEDLADMVLELDNDNYRKVLNWLVYNASLIIRLKRANEDQQRQLVQSGSSK